MKSLAHPGHRDEVRQRIRTIEPGRVPRWGRMNAPQVVCHMADAFRMAFGEIAVAPRDGLRLPLKIVALWVPLRWPPGINTSRELDQAEGCGTAPAAFEADVETLLALLDRMPAARDLDGREHPVFGRMSRAAWLRWGYLHVDHHLRQFGA